MIRRSPQRRRYGSDHLALAYEAAFFGLFQTSRIALCRELGSIEEVILWLKSTFLRIERFAAAGDACSGHTRFGSSSLEQSTAGPSHNLHATEQHSLCQVGSVASGRSQDAPCARPALCMGGTVPNDWRDNSLLSGYILLTLLVLGCKPAKIETWLEQNAECFSSGAICALDGQAYRGPMAVQASADAAVATDERGKHAAVDAGNLTAPSAFVLSDAAIGIDEAVIERMA